jgi:hypothetical protein
MDGHDDDQEMDSMVTRVGFRCGATPNYELWRQYRYWPSYVINKRSGEEAAEKLCLKYTRSVGTVLHKHLGAISLNSLPH